MARRPRSRIKREIPAVGTSLTARHLGKEYHAAIVAAPQFPQDRAVKYDGLLYSSLTAAAKAITKYPTNGWTFWRFETRR